MDTQAGEVTIAHGPIPAMGWPAMTMTFGLRDPAMLRGLKRGDRVAFAVGKQPQDGAYVIERIERAPGQ
jgi:Cu(I)/Ag(I) efflux system membrane fusion protein